MVLRLKSTFHLSIVLLVAQMAFGQSQEAKPKAKRSIGLVFSPDYCYRSLTATDEVSKVFKSMYNSIEKPIFGYTTGLVYSQQISSRLALESGLLFSAKGFKLEQGIIRYPPEPPSTDFKERKLVYNFNFLDIPLRLYGTVGNSKLKFLWSGGIQANLLLSAKEKRSLTNVSGKTQKDNTNITEGFNRFNVSASASAGVAYELNSKTTLRFAPTFRHSIFRIIDSKLETRLWSAGIEIGCFMHLN